MVKRYYTNGLRFETLEDAKVEAKKYHTNIYEVIIGE